MQKSILKSLSQKKTTSQAATVDASLENSDDEGGNIVIKISDEPEELISRTEKEIYS